MLRDLNFDRILLVDIETVPVYPDFESMPGAMQGLWDRKTERVRDSSESAAGYYRKAGVYSEFAKVICISAGYFQQVKEAASPHPVPGLRIKSFSGDNEKELLAGFAALLDSHYNIPGRHMLCGHNIREFDVPFLCRRMLVNGLPLPRILDIQGMKPWEVPHLDTMQMWRFGDFKNYTSLDLLAAVFDIPNPKSDIHGSDVARIYWGEKDLPRIVRYCCRDVVTVAQLLRRFRGEPLIPETHVHIVE